MKTKNQKHQEELNDLVKDALLLANVAEKTTNAYKNMKEAIPKKQKVIVWLLVVAFICLPLASLLTKNLMYLYIFSCSITFYFVIYATAKIFKGEKNTLPKYPEIDSDLALAGSYNEIMVSAMEIRKNADGKISVNEALSILAASQPEKYKQAVEHVRASYAFARRRKYTKQPKQVSAFDEPKFESKEVEFETETENTSEKEKENNYDISKEE